MRTVIFALLFMMSASPVSALPRSCHPAPCVGKHVCPLYIICDLGE